MGKVIIIRAETKDELDKIKHPGQTYDGIITEMIEKLKGEKKC